jgi:hypothetical protein
MKERLLGSSKVLYRSAVAREDIVMAERLANCSDAMTMAMVELEMKGDWPKPWFHAHRLVHEIVRTTFPMQNVLLLGL